MIPGIPGEAGGSTRLVGMVHLAALPGSPRFSGDLDAVIAAALADTRALIGAGFDAVIVENLGDAPYHAERVPPVTVAAMTRVVSEITAAATVPVGVNVLRNDAEAALAVAVAAGASLIRVNVLSGTMFTDQGPIVGRAAALARERSRLAPWVRVFADVFVKHAVPPSGLTIERAATDLWERAGADAVVVSGLGTGEEADPALVAAVAAAVPEAPLYVGSGVNEANVGSVLGMCAGVIVGTAIKVGGITTAPVDPDRARALVQASSR